MRDLRRRQRRYGHRRRCGQRRRPDHRRHRRDPRQHGAARGRRRRHRAGRDGRVPLLRRPRPRLGVAGAADRAAPGPVPADVGDARRHLDVRGRPGAPYRTRDHGRQLDRATGPAGQRVRHVARAGDPRAAHRDGPDPGVRRPLHPALGTRAGAGADQHQGRDPRGARHHRRRAGRLPVLVGVRQDAVAAHPDGRRRAPRRDAAALPPARRDADPAGPAQGRVRHRHPRRRHQRADPHRPVQRTVEVRRHPPAPAPGARVPADRRARRTGRLRHDRPRRRRGSRARHRERPTRAQGRRRSQEAAQGQPQEGARGFRVVGREDLREALDRYAGVSSCRVCA